MRGRELWTASMALLVGVSTRVRWGAIVLMLAGVVVGGAVGGGLSVTEAARWCVKPIHQGHGGPRGGGGGGTTTTPTVTTPTVTTPTTTTPTVTTPTTTTPTVPSDPPVSTGVKHGVYVGAANPDGVEWFADTFGIDATLGVEFTDRSSWAGVTNLGWELSPWGASPYNLVLALPMLPDSGGTLAQGAAGQFNVHFESIARQLVAYGFDHAIIRLGWELNGTWYRWGISGQAAAFAAYWRQVVTAMRVIAPGLRFDWNTANGSYVNPEPAYPGDAFVDYIGQDIYDQSWAGGLDRYPGASVAWQDMTSGQPYGLDWVARFAAAHGKPISLPEWGLAIRGDGHGGGDNPAFIQNMHDWIAGHNVAYEAYFNFDAPDGAHDLANGRFPLGAAKYKSLF